MKKIVVTVAATLAFGAILFTPIKKDREAELQEAVANNIIRFHVIANSDSENDQSLKLVVRDKVVTMLQEKLKNVDDLTEARTLLRSEIEEVEQMAEAEMRSRGYDYTAEASLGNSYFPIKKYGDMTFPAGEYEALRIKLGKAEGKNWWCVMYPSLCFVDSTYQVVPDESKERIKNVLTEEDYQALLGSDENVSFGFKLLEWLDKLR